MKPMFRIALAGTASLGLVFAGAVSYAGVVMNAGAEANAGTALKAEPIRAATSFPGRALKLARTAAPAGSESRAVAEHAEGEVMSDPVDPGEPIVDGPTFDENGNPVTAMGGGGGTTGGAGGGGGGGGGGRLAGLAGLASIAAAVAAFDSDDNPGKVASPAT